MALFENKTDLFDFTDKLKMIGAFYHDRANELLTENNGFNFEVALHLNFSEQINQVVSCITEDWESMIHK